MAWRHGSPNHLRTDYVLRRSETLAAVWRGGPRYILAQLAVNCARRVDALTKQPCRQPPPLPFDGGRKHQENVLIIRSCIAAPLACAKKYPVTPNCATGDSRDQHDGAAHMQVARFRNCRHPLGPKPWGNNKYRQDLFAVKDHVKQIRHAICCRAIGNLVEEV